MKKILFVALALSWSSVFGCCCNDNNPEVYVGLDAHIKQLKSENKHNLPGAGLFAGFKINPYLGAEAGANMSYKYRHGLRLDNKNVYASLMGYIPMPVVNLVAGVGLSHVKLTAKEHGFKDVVSKAVPRIAAGLSYDHSDKWSARYLAVWEKSSKLDWDLKNSLNHHLGLLYKF